MTIASLADYRISLRERTMYYKTAVRAAPTIIAVPQVSNWSSLWDASGTPAAATLAVGNTANGVVPDVNTTGAPSIMFGSGAGYLSEVSAHGMANVGGAGQAGTIIALYDRLFHSGAHAFNAADTLTAQPSYSARVPGGNYNGTQIWVECVTAFTGATTIEVTYTDQSGNVGHTTTAFAPFTPYGVSSAGQEGAMAPLPLASGDSGVQKIETVTSTVATAGTFNIVVMRPLWRGFVNMRTIYDTVSLNNRFSETRHWMDRTGMPRIFNNACLAGMYKVIGLAISSAPTLTFDISAEIASK